MVSGHLQIKNGTYYIVINYKTASGKRKQVWTPTGLPEKNNKKKAEKLLFECRHNFIPPPEEEVESELKNDMLFADFMEQWLEIIRPGISVTTFRSYELLVNNNIAPYFRNKGTKLSEITARDIQNYYLAEQRRVSSNTVIHHHVVIHKALKYAVKMDMLMYNPADKVERPKRVKYVAGYYKAEELEDLFSKLNGNKYELLIEMTAFYGFRRSEVLGLKWNSIDFERNTITVKHTVVETVIDGQKMIVGRDTAKTKSSLRTLPLVEGFREKLLQLKATQKENERLCGNCYNTEYKDYIFVDPMGNLFKPDTVTEQFGKFLEKNGLRKIRFHDLRHSCASLLLAKGVQMKSIQEWLGHSDISTTANTYSHLDFQNKITSAGIMDKALKIPESTTESEENAKWTTVHFHSSD